MVLAARDVPAAPVLAVMALGIVLALVGHVVRDRRLVGTGIAVLFLATALMVVAAFVAYHGDTSADPRPAEDYQKPF